MVKKLKYIEVYGIVKYTAIDDICVGDGNSWCSL
jgi:hypothetical protein